MTSTAPRPFQPPSRQLVSPFARKWEHLGFFGNVYFLLLDATFAQTIVFTITAYALVCIFLIALTLPFVDDFVTANGTSAPDVVLAATRDESDPASSTQNGSSSGGGDVDFGVRLTVALRVVVTHLVTMGPSEFVPAPSLDWLFLFATLQQFAGIFCNVFLIAIVLRKVELPTPALIFSPVALITKRDGQLVFLIRVGNLRCNVIQRPEVELQLFTSALTQEGESRIRSQVMEAKTMPLMYSQCVVEHVVDESSPLFPFLLQYSDGEFQNLSKNELCVCVLFRGFVSRKKHPSPSNLSCKTCIICSVCHVKNGWGWVFFPG